MYAPNYPVDCPPEDAAPAAGLVLRFIRSIPPAVEHMRSWEDEGRSPGVGHPCQRCALSVLRSRQDVALARKTIPLFRKWHVAEASLHAAHGVIKQTGGNAWHHSLWVTHAHRATLHTSFMVEPT